MLPCCANQKPNLKPPILKLSNQLEIKIPKPKEARNQIKSKELTIFKLEIQ